VEYRITENHILNILLLIIACVDFPHLLAILEHDTWALDPGVSRGNL